MKLGNLNRIDDDIEAESETTTRTYRLLEMLAEGIALSKSVLRTVWPSEQLAERSKIGNHFIDREKVEAMMAESFSSLSNADH